MQMSDHQSKLKARNASLSDFGSRALEKILHRRITARIAGVMALSAMLICPAPGAFAQEERPQIVPGERKPQKKKDAGPRAVGVLQMMPSGKASLVPIAILINGKFWDASAYKADPVPMSLDPGTIYEAERTGNSLGLFTVGAALHRNSAASGQAPWIGTGTFRPNDSEPEKQPAKANPVPVGIDASEGPPRLTRDPAAVNKPPHSASPPSSTPSSSAPASAPSKPNGTSSGDEPPRLTKPAPSPSDASSDSSPPPKADTKASEESKAGDTKGSAAKADQAKVATSDSGAGEANRPRLRRGKPVESFADDEIPGYSKTGAKPAQGDLSKAGPIATEGDVQLVPAISDAGGPDLRSFVFQWLKGEEDDRRKQLTDFAKEQLRVYIAARAKASVTATTAHPRAARTAAKLKDPVLENVRVVAYDLWVSNQPVMILSADGHMPPGQSQGESELQYSVLVVAYPDIYNNLHKLYVGITDKFHLDVTPRLELVDAVDADGDGRGELLFRQISDQGTGWVIYRATADKLWKMFDNLSPQ
jgi:hypothetical protein